MPSSFFINVLLGCAVVFGCLGPSTASAATIYWTDWTTSNSNGGFTGLGTITTPTSTVNVTYNNPQGVGFFQTSGGTDYWNPSSPYTSATVSNRPTGTDIVALQFAGNQTLTFSQAIGNPVFSVVSLNGNGYAFLNQDFNILSFGAGYWGNGTLTKNVVPLGGGNFEYQLIGTGEPHGTIQFLGTFSSLTWRSLSNEYWNGFTVGVQGTAQELATTPEPASVVVFGTVTLVGLLRVRRSRGTSAPQG